HQPFLALLECVVLDGERAHVDERARHGLLPSHSHDCLSSWTGRAFVLTSSAPGLFAEMLRLATNEPLTAPFEPGRPRATFTRPLGEAGMEFRILGSMEVLDGARRIELPAGRGRALLALLVLHAGEAVASERLIDELWGEQPPATVATVVQGLVSRLRKQLEPGRGRREAPTIL